MPLIAFLNELSEPIGRIAPLVARDAMTGLAKVVGDLRRHRFDLILQSRHPILSLQFGDGYSAGQWLNDPETRDYISLLLTTQNRAPMRFGLDPAFVDEVDLQYTFEGATADALGLAHLANGLAVSFKLGSRWNTNFLDVDRCYLTEDENGALVLLSDHVSIRHASDRDHVRSHRDWLQSAGHAAIESFEQFEAERAMRYPNLRFLDRALQQLTAILPGEPWWTAVLARLEELQEAVTEWDSKASEQLVAGATAVIQQARRGGRASPWLAELLKRKSPKLAAVALANKTARIAWKMMVTGENYAAKAAPAVVAGAA
jgi:hypothetical protein